MNTILKLRAEASSDANFFKIANFALKFGGGDGFAQGEKKIGLNVLHHAQLC